MSNPKIKDPSRKLRGPAQYDPSPTCPREQIISEAAYFYAERRGFIPGNEMSDWLQAEADIESMSNSGH